MKKKTSERLEDILGGGWEKHYESEGLALRWLTQLFLGKAEECRVLREQVQHYKEKVYELEGKCENYEEIKKSVNNLTAERSKWLRKLKRAGLA